MTFQITNVKSETEFDIKYQNGILRFTSTKIMLKWEWKEKFKTIMDIKGGRWGCTFKKKYYKQINLDGTEVKATGRKSK